MFTTPENIEEKLLNRMLTSDVEQAALHLWEHHKGAPRFDFYDQGDSFEGRRKIVTGVARHMYQLGCYEAQHLNWHSNKIDAAFGVYRALYLQSAYHAFDNSGQVLITMNEKIKLMQEMGEREETIIAFILTATAQGVSADMWYVDRSLPSLMETDDEG